jgi:hypothetical protein
MPPVIDVCDSFATSVPWLNMLDSLSLPPFRSPEACTGLFQYSLESFCCGQSAFSAQKIGEVAVMIVRIACGPGVRKTLHQSLASAKHGVRCTSQQKRANPTDAGRETFIESSSATPSGKDLRLSRSRSKENAPDHAWARTVTGDVLFTVTDPTGVLMDGTMHAGAYHRILQAREHLIGSSIVNESGSIQTTAACALLDGTECGTVLLLRDATLLHFAKSGPHLSVHPVNIAGIFLAGERPSLRVQRFLDVSRALSRSQLFDSYAFAGHFAAGVLRKESDALVHAADTDEDRELLDIIEQTAAAESRTPSVSRTIAGSSHEAENKRIRVDLMSSVTGDFRPWVLDDEFGSVESYVPASAQPFREITNMPCSSAPSLTPSKRPSGYLSLSGSTAPNGLAPAETPVHSSDADSFLLELAREAEKKPLARSTNAADPAPQPSNVSGDTVLAARKSVQETPSPASSKDDLDVVLWQLVPET